MVTALLIFLGIVFIVMILLSQVVRFAEKYSKMEEIPAVSGGRYIAGLPEYTSPTDHVICAINEQDFVFRHRVMRIELGRIPRDSINQIIVGNKLQIVQRLTIARMQTLGIISLVVPKEKRDEEYYLVIDWDDNRGTGQNAVFEFSDNASANLAANTLNKYTLPKTVNLKSEEKH